MSQEKLSTDQDSDYSVYDWAEAEREKRLHKRKKNKKPLFGPEDQNLDNGQLMEEMKRWADICNKDQDKCLKVIMDFFMIGMEKRIFPGGVSVKLDDTEENRIKSLCADKFDPSSHGPNYRRCVEKHELQSRASALVPRARARARMIVGEATESNSAALIVGFSTVIGVGLLVLILVFYCFYCSSPKPASKASSSNKKSMKKSFRSKSGKSSRKSRIKSKGGSSKKSAAGGKNR